MGKKSRLFGLVLALFIVLPSLLPAAFFASTPLRPQTAEAQIGPARCYQVAEALFEVDCPDDIAFFVIPGRCYFVDTSTSPTTFSEISCPDAGGGGGGGGGDTSDPPQCYSFLDGTAVDCPDDDSLEDGKCYLVEFNPAPSVVRETLCAGAGGGGGGGAGGGGGGGGGDGAIPDDVDDGITVGTEQTDFQSEEQRCKTGSLNIIFRWILCPVITLLFNVLDFFYTDLIIPVLYFSPLSANTAEGTPEAALFNIWNAFRIIGNVAFVIVFLLAVFGQSLAGFEFFSAYEIRKILPRLVIGIVGIQLSWYLVAFMIDLFNLIGGGIRGLILAPVDGLRFDIIFDLNSTLEEIAAAAGLIGAVTAAWWVGGLVSGLPLILFPIVFAMFLAFMTILIRRGLLFLLIVTSPIALAAWILPNTAGIFKAWWSFFWKALLLYPLIIALIASGQLMAKVMTAANSAPGATQQSVFNSIAATIALFAPYFLIPFTFRFAGGVIALVAGNMSRRGQAWNRRLFGDERDPDSYRGRRKYNMGMRRLHKKDRLMRYSGKASEVDWGKGSSSRTKRWGGSTVRGGGKVVQFLGSQTGHSNPEREAMLQEEAQQQVNSWAQQDNPEIISAILSDHDLVNGEYVTDENGNVTWQGNQLKPEAIQAAKRYRKSRYHVQAALNNVMGQIAGEEAKVEHAYNQFFSGAEREDFDWQAASVGFSAMTGGGKLSDFPKLNKLYNRFVNPYSMHLDRAERAHMISQAADYNNAHSADFLFRDPENNFVMPGYTWNEAAGEKERITDRNSDAYKAGLSKQTRWLKRVHSRLSEDRDLQKMTASWWHGVGDMMESAEGIYNDNASRNGGTFNGEDLTANERKVLQHSLRIYDSLVNTPIPPESTRGPIDTIEPRRALKAQATAFLGGGQPEEGESYRSPTFRAREAEAKARLQDLESLGPVLLTAEELRGE